MESSFLIGRKRKHEEATGGAAGLNSNFLQSGHGGKKIGINEKANEVFKYSQAAK